MNKPKPSRKNVLVGVAVFFGVFGLYFLYQTISYVSTDNAQIEAHSVMLASKVAGFIADVKVVEGQKVKADEVLVDIDDRDYQNTVKQVQGDLTSVEARKRDAEKNYKRISSLYAQGAVSQQQYDTVSASYSDVKAKYDAVAAQFSQAQLNLENTKVKAPADGFIARKSVEKGQLASPGIPLIGFVGAQALSNCDEKNQPTDRLSRGSGIAA